MEIVEQVLVPAEVGIKYVYYVYVVLAPHAKKKKARSTSVRVFYTCILGGGTSCTS